MSEAADPQAERSRFLRRAIAAEAELESARERVAELEGHLRSIVRGAADPLVLGMIDQCAGLINEALSVGTGGSWRTRALAQVRALKILRRDEI